MHIASCRIHCNYVHIAMPVRREGEEMRIELGIIGTGRIAGRFVEMVHRYFPEQVSIAGVYNPNKESAEAFAKNNAIAFADDELGDFLDAMTRLGSGSSEKTAKAVYIASPHQTHYAYAKCALEAGFHVLCEKPMTLERVQAEEVFALAHANNLVLMEGIKTKYCPGFQKLEEVAKSGIIGDIVDVEAGFTRIGPTDSREYWDDEYGGSFLEFGRYPMLPIYELLAASHQNEKMDISFHTILSDIAMDKYTKAQIRWVDEEGFETCLATIKTGLGVKSEGELLISGTNGYIQVPSPWWLMKKFVVRFEDPKKTMEYTAEYADSGLQYELQNFLERIRMRSTAQNGVGNWEAETEAASQSIWCADIFERFLKYFSNWKKRPGYQARKIAFATEKKDKEIGIWAHRGCSMQYPENTLLSFQKAAEIKGICGIEFDVQYTKDKQLVVFHDETLDRVTNGTGYLRDYTLEELKQLYVWEKEKIPTLAEVFALLKPYCIENGLRLNIELKTGIWRYEGIEQMTVGMARQYGLEDYIVYSSFLPESIVRIKQINPNAETGILARDVSECLRIWRAIGCDALHPSSAGMDCRDICFDKKEKYLLREDGGERCFDIKEELLPRADDGAIRHHVRMWNSTEPLYGSGKSWKEKDLLRFERFGITDIITNVPEYYLT